MELDAMPEVLTAKNIAEHLQMTTENIYIMCAEGKIPSFKIGGSRRILKAAYIKWLDERVKV